MSKDLKSQLGEKSAHPKMSSLGYQIYLMLKLKCINYIKVLKFLVTFGRKTLWEEKLIGQLWKI
jgi:hypothetical protein